MFSDLELRRRARRAKKKAPNGETKPAN